MIPTQLDQVSAKLLPNYRLRHGDLELEIYFKNIDFCITERSVLLEHLIKMKKF